MFYFFGIFGAGVFGAGPDTGAFGAGVPRESSLGRYELSSVLSTYACSPYCLHAYFTI